MTLQQPARSSRLRDRYGPAAVVTGASSGIGEQFARGLAAEGFDLLLVARRSELLQQLAEELRGKHGVSVHVLAADLADPGSTDTVVTTARKMDVGLLICSAGFGTSGAFIDGNLADECAMVDVNCRSLMALTWHFGKQFADRRRGGIVLMSSLVAFQGVPTAANYAATKAYVQSLAEGLHYELKPLGVHVLASAPGPVHSGFAGRANMQMGMALHPQDVAAATLTALGRRSTVRPGWLSKALEWSLKPLPRWGRVRMMGIVMRGMTRSRAPGNRHTPRVPLRQRMPINLPKPPWR
ncbi:MAG: SDR family oxidoreductase [Phycisphaeraceae bacterium]|nr:SDR family oxidoreductase [Phycisphaeraceae bacterium]